MPNYVVLVSLDGGRTFAVYGGEEPKRVKASGGQSAAEKVREADPTLRKNEEAQFLPLTKFKPLRKRKQLVEAWRWSPVDGEQRQQELSGDA